MSENPLDEEKDPYFLAGKNRLQGLDYKGAIESFEKALQVNPRSAAAHKELAVLYEQRASDYPAAIYHYEKHLRLRPNSEFGDIARQHITACKMELAKTVSFGVVTREIQRDLDRLNSENQGLRQQIETLKNQSAQRREYLTNGPPVSSFSNLASPLLNSQKFQTQLKGTNIFHTGPIAPALSKSRTHIVKSGDTLSSMALQYKVKTSAIQAANPSLNSRKLRIGQAISIPPGAP